MKITNVCDYEQKPGFVVMSIKNPELSEREAEFIRALYFKHREKELILNSWKDVVISDNHRWAYEFLNKIRGSFKAASRCNDPDHTIQMTGDLADEWIAEINEICPDE